MTAGNTGHLVYVTAVSALLQGASVTRSGKRDFRLRCSTASACRTVADAYLATRCDSFAQAAAANGSDPSAAQLAGRRSNTAKMQAVVGSRYERSVVLQMDGLQPGRLYKLCTDLDGIFGPGSTILTSGESGVSVYITPLSTLGPPLVVPARASSSVLLDGCGTYCSAASVGYLAATCAPNFACEKYPIATPLRLTNQRWWLDLPRESSLVPFAYYSVCLDIDGPAGYLVSGDTGQKMYISGLPSKSLVVRLSHTTNINKHHYNHKYLHVDIYEHYHFHNNKHHNNINLYINKHQYDHNHDHHHHKYH